MFTSVLTARSSWQQRSAGVADAAGAGVGRTLMSAFAKQLRGETEFATPPGGGTIARMIFATPEALAPVDPADKTPGTAALASR